MRVPAACIPFLALVACGQGAAPPSGGPPQVSFVTVAEQPVTLQHRAAGADQRL